MNMNLAFAIYLPPTSPLIYKVTESHTVSEEQEGTHSLKLQELQQRDLFSLPSLEERRKGPYFLGAHKKKKKSEKEK